MNSSPNPPRRFSRWKTSKYKFVLGGKSFVTGGKNRKANDVKDVQKKGAKVRASPRFHSERPSTDKDALEAESQIVEARDSNIDSKPVDDSLQQKSLCSDNEKIHDSSISSLPHALSVLSPNVCISKKEVQECDLLLPGNDDNNSQSSFTVHTNPLDHGTEQGSSPNSISTDKENTSAVNLDKENSSVLQPGRSDVSSSLVDGVSAAVGPIEGENVEVSDLKTSPRKQSLRDRSLLSSSAVLMQKNYPFSQTSKRDNSNKKDGKRSPIDKQLSASLDISRHGKGKHKVSKGRQSKSLENSDGEENDVCSLEDNSQRVRNISLTPSTNQDSLTSELAGEKEWIHDSQTELPKSKSLLNHSKRKSRASKEREPTEVMEPSPKKSRKLSDSSSVRKETSINQTAREKKYSKKVSPQSSAQASHQPSSGRPLRDRSTLTTPQIQYPAEFISAALLKSLSEKAMKLLSPSPNVSFSQAEPPIKKSSKVQRQDKELNISKGKNVNQSSLSYPEKKHLKKSSQNDKPISKSSARASEPKYQMSVKSLKNNLKTSKECPLSPICLKSMNGDAVCVNDRKRPSKDTVSQTDSDSGKERERSVTVERMLKVASKKKGQTLSSSNGNQMSVSSQRSLEGTDARLLRDMEPEDEQSLVIVNGSSQEIDAVGRKTYLMKNKQISKSTLQQMELPHSSHRMNGNVLDETTRVSQPKTKKSLKRRLFENSMREPKIKKLSTNRYKHGRDVLLWSETGEQRKASNVTSLDIIYNDVIELDDHLKDLAETDYLQQRLIGKVMGHMKRSLKSQIYQIEQVKDLQSDIKKSQDRCKTIKEEIAQQEEKNKRLEIKLLRKTETEKKNLRQWMKNLKSLVVSTRTK